MMDNEQKGREYQRLMYQYDMLSNKINQIKGSDFELNSAQLNEIRQIQNEQQKIMNLVQRLMDMR